MKEAIVQSSCMFLIQLVAKAVIPRKTRCYHVPEILPAPDCLRRKLLMEGCGLPASYIFSDGDYFQMSGPEDADVRVEGPSLLLVWLQELLEPISNLAVPTRILMLTPCGQKSHEAKQRQPKLGPAQSRHRCLGATVGCSALAMCSTWVTTT